MNVAVVGGSLAGCSAAILFQRAGHRVEVFERATGALVGRGGGIATPERVLQMMIQYDLVDKDFARCVSQATPLVVRTAEHPRAGHRPWAIPQELATFHWSALWKQLRKRVPDASYRAGVEIADTEPRDDNRVVLTRSDGVESVHDLVIFADGSRSMGRKRLFPEVEPEYRGYAIWRGLVPESAIADADLLGSTTVRVSFAEGTGHLVVYVLPSPKGSTAKGDRLIDWAAYVDVPDNRVQEFMTDRTGEVRISVMPPGMMRDAEEARLKAEMREVLPEFFADLVDRTKSTHAQLIHSASLPAYVSGRQLVIGDAGTVTPPFTGTGVFKGFQNAAGLLETIDGLGGSLDNALQSWSAKQIRLGHRLTKLGLQMEDAFLRSPLDLSTADATSAEAWWRESVTYLPGMSPGSTTTPAPAD